MEYVYKLNIKTLEEIFKTEALSYFDKLCNSEEWIYKKFHGRDIFKSIAFNGYFLDSAMLFYKNQGHKGDVHVDSDVLEHVWGINWQITGTGTMDYWHPESISKTTHLTDHLDTKKIVYEISKPPDKTYIMMPGVYLVYASLPHRASGYGRMLLSVRAEDKFKTPWAGVVDRFKDYIK